MKLYSKVIDNQKHIMPINKIVVIKDGMQIFNPTEDILYDDGWVEYVPPVNELTEEERLVIEKNRIIDDIIRYDSSDAVNTFYIGKESLWIDKVTRFGLKSRFDAEFANGQYNTILWYNGSPFNLETEKAIKMLNVIELYASSCYDNTQLHIYNVKCIDNIEDLKKYDYTVGYPEKIIFE